MEKFKIVADSSADLLTLGTVSFESAPLKIITDDKEYVDDKDIDVEGMINDLATYKGKSKSSCPSVDAYVSAFDGAEYVFCVAITSQLSGSYNSACAAKNIFEEQHPERKVFVLDSRSAGPGLTLIVRKLEELINAGEEFDSICEKITEYRDNIGLVFVLESVRNFANNGRINPLVAKAVGLLGIRVLAKASEKGELVVLEKPRGEVKALATILNRLEIEGLKKKRVSIGHALNPDGAEKLKNAIIEQFGASDVELHAMRGLCSFYAEKGGLLVAFEKN